MNNCDYLRAAYWRGAARRRDASILVYSTTNLNGYWLMLMLMSLRPQLTSSASDRNTRTLHCHWHLERTSTIALLRHMLSHKSSVRPFGTGGTRARNYIAAHARLCLLEVYNNYVLLTNICTVLYKARGSRQRGTVLACESLCLTQETVQTYKCCVGCVQLLYRMTRTVSWKRLPSDGTRALRIGQFCRCDALFSCSVLINIYSCFATFATFKSTLVTRVLLFAARGASACPHSAFDINESTAAQEPHLSRVSLSQRYP